MGIKLTLLLFLCVSCGAQVKVPTTLKDASFLKNDDLFQLAKAQKNPNRLFVNNRMLPVSIYSSKGALQFYDSLPSNAQFSVKFIGGIGPNEVILEEIKKAP